MGDRRLAAGVTGAVALALALRLGPLYWSPLPFNPDGIGYAAVARDALAAGRLPIESMATDTVAFTSLLAVTAELTGVAPLYVAQGLSAAVGAATVLVGAGVARRLAYRVADRAGAATGPPAAGTGDGSGGERDAADRRAPVAGALPRRAALLAGVLLAVEGVYLYRSMATDEQTVGLLVVPAFAVVVARGLATGRPAWLALAIPLAAVLPPLHNHAGLVAAVAVTVLVALWLVRAAGRRRVAGAIAAVAALWAWVLGYHPAAARLTPLRVVQAGRLLRTPGLFVAWVVLACAGAVWFTAAGRRTQRATLGAGLAALFALVAANAVRAVFPGTTTTPPLLLAALLPLALPAVLAARAGPAATLPDADGRVVVGLIGGSMGVLGWALTAALSFEYLATAWRTQLYLHLPVLALAGLAAAGLLGDGRRRPAVRIGVATLVLVAAAASAPVAYAGLELRTYKGVTTEAEFGATAVAADAFASFATDDHLRRVAGYHGGNATPVATYGWLRGGAPPPDCPVVAQRSWTTTGAQFHPQRPARIDEGTFRSWTGRNNVVYVAAGKDPLLVVVPPGNATGCDAPGS